MNALHAAVWVVLSVASSSVLLSVAASWAVEQTSQPFGFEQVNESTPFTWSTSASEDANYTQGFFIIKNLYVESGNGPFEHEYPLSQAEMSAKRIEGVDRLRTILFARRGRISQFQIKLCRAAKLDDCVRSNFWPILVAPRALRLTFNDLPAESWNDYFIPATNAEVREAPIFTFFYQGEAGAPNRYQVVLEGGLDKTYVIRAATQSAQAASEQPETYEVPDGQVLFNSHYRFTANQALPINDTGVVINWSVRPCVDHAFHVGGNCSQDGCIVDAASDIQQREVCAVVSHDYQTRTFTALPPLSATPPPDITPPADGPTFTETVAAVFDHPRCLTCHRMTQQGDPFGNAHLIARLSTVVSNPTISDLSAAGNCTGCHLPAFVNNLSNAVPDTNGPADHGFDWFAPMPGTPAANWAATDDPVERCNIVKAGVTAADMEHHLLHDGRVVWGVYPPPTNQPTAGFGGLLPNVSNPANPAFVNAFPVVDYDEWVVLVSDWIDGGMNCGNAQGPVTPEPNPQTIVNRFPPSTRITREGGDYPHNQALQVGLICQPHPASAGAMCDSTYYVFNAEETLAEFQANGNQLNQMHNIQTQPSGTTLPITITNGANRNPGDTVILSYYSVDQEGNQEAIKRDVFTITQGDVTPPVSRHEVSYTYNSFVNVGRFRLVLSCEDNSGNCTVRYQRTGVPAEGTYTSRTNIILREDQVAEYRFYATDPSNNREPDQVVIFDPVRFAESDPPVVSTNLSPGAYSEPFDLTLSCVDQNTQDPMQAHECVIYYTTDGADPAADAALLYNAPISLSEEGTHTVKVLAVDTSPRRNATEILTFDYDIDPSLVSESDLQSP